MKKLFYFFKIIFKGISSQFFTVAPYCEDCGVDLQPLAIPRDVERYIALARDVVCYNCFSIRCKELDINTEWRLEDTNAIKLEDLLAVMGMPGALAHDVYLQKGLRGLISCLEREDRIRLFDRLEAQNRT